MRTCRYNLPGVLYHCITRFVDREWFFDEAEERERYLFLLGRALERTDWRCLAYALMSNHIHLAVIAGRLPMASWTKPTHSPFANWMNKRHGRVGPIFADRVKDFQILPENEASVLAYVHNNPVRARVARVAADSNWSSHRAYVGLDPAPSWLCVDEGLARSGMPDPDVFDNWVNRTPGAAFDITFERKRLALRRRGAIEIGTPTKGPDGARFPLMGRPFSHTRPDPRRVIEVVAELSDVAFPVICSRRRIPAACDARMVVVHCGRLLGITPSDTAASLGISAQAVNAMGRREIQEHYRIIFDLALERLSIEAWGDRRSVPPASISNGVPDQLV
jgi:hypothetical protein